MANSPSTFLTRQGQVVEYADQWGGGAVRFTVWAYVGDTLPDLALVTSVRGIITHAGQVLAVRDPERVHIIPGGRREPGETLEQTLRREVLEESGWALNAVRVIGGLIYQHLTPCPPNYPYPYPYFAQVVFSAEATDYHPTARHIDGYELDAQFRPLADVQALPLTPGERLLLDAVQQPPA